MVGDVISVLLRVVKELSVEGEEAEPPRDARGSNYRTDFIAQG